MTVEATTAQPLLEGLTFQTKHRCFGRGRKLTFRPGVNLLVGDQGSGKSTTLQMILQLGDKHEFTRNQAREIVTAQVSGTGKFPLFAFDFEKDNPRTLSHFVDNITAQVASIYSSHGESGLGMLRGLAKQLENADEKVLLLLDEPDTALSPRSAHELARILATIAAGGHQILAAVHNPIVIASQEQVYSLEHRKWMRSDAFLAAHAAT